MGVDIALALVMASLGAVWLFVYLHSQKDIRAHRKQEQHRVAYGMSKFATPLERERLKGARLAAAFARMQAIQAQAEQHRLAAGAGGLNAHAPWNRVALSSRRR